MGYAINASGETAVLARRDAFQTVADGEGKPAWYLTLEAEGRKLYGDDAKLLKDWETTLQRTCVVQARRLRTEVSESASLLPKRWAAVDKMSEGLVVFDCGRRLVRDRCPWLYVPCMGRAL